MVRYPDWCCQHCGEPLRTVPCLNCIQLERMEEEDDSDNANGRSAEKDEATVTGTE